MNTDTPTYAMLAKMRDRAMLAENQLATVTEQLDEAREYADKLAEGLPDGMLPKDVEVLRSANTGLAAELTAVTAQRDEAREQHQILYEQTGNTIYEARKQRDRLAEALREIRYNHTDKAERMAVAALKYLENVQDH